MSTAYPCENCSSMSHPKADAEEFTCPKCGQRHRRDTRGGWKAAGVPRDPNEAAADAVHRLTDEGETMPPDLEAAWERWIGGIQGTDERVRTLLRAAFEAGVEAASLQQ